MYHLNRRKHYEKDCCTSFGCSHGLCTGCLRQEHCACPERARSRGSRACCGRSRGTRSRTRRTRHRFPAVGEGDAASNMLTDVEAGADIFGFPQDQLARLVAANALIELSDENVAKVTAENDAGSVAAATMAGTVYAFPMTSDNGYFLFYDKSVITDPSNLEAIIAACEAAGKSFYYDLRSGWYMPAFFFGAGCTLTYDTDDAGAFTKCNIDYASDKGVGAMKALIQLAKSPAFVNGSSVSNATNAAAIIDGPWDVTAAKEMFGENYACAKLPTVKINGVYFNKQ